MNCNLNWREADIIDLILGNVQALKAAQLREHLIHCPDCQALYSQWKEILGAVNRNEAPPAHMKERLLQAIPRRRRRSIRIPKPFLSYSAVGSLAIMIAFGIFFQLKDQQPAPHPWIADQPIHEHPFMKLETDFYEISPVADSNIRGYAWLNDDTSEMLLMVDGLVPVREKDYQVWIKTPGQQLRNAGLIHLVNGKGQLYIRGVMRNEVEQIIISMEPRGGSNWPTDPDALWMQFRE